MYKKLLSEKFFKDNPYMENSVQRFIYSSLLYEGLEDIADELTIKHGLLSDERLERIAREKELIQSEQNSEMIFQLLRKKLKWLIGVYWLRKHWNLRKCFFLQWWKS